ncbi:MAG TPA: hypothetical protein V6D05_15385, partial [Stenomitos sp.]
QVAQDTDPPSGALNSSKSSYTDASSNGPAFYTNGAVTLTRKKNEDIELSGTYKGSWGSFNADKLKKQ